MSELPKATVQSEPGAGLATGLHMGSEVDMGTPGFPPADPSLPPG